MLAVLSPIRRTAKLRLGLRSCLAGTQAEATARARMAQRISHGLRNDMGGSVIEMAFVCPVVVSILMGLVQMSLALFTYDYVGDAARAGSRYAMVRGAKSCANTPNLPNCGATAAQIQSYVQGIKYPGVNSSNLTVTTTWLSASTTQPTTWTACGNECNAPGNQAKVVVTYAFPLGVPFLPHSTLNLTSTSQVVIAQ
jgi:Flp pilus assembly protein TadG